MLGRCAFLLLFHVQVCDSVSVSSSTDPVPNAPLMRSESSSAAEKVTNQVLRVEASGDVGPMEPNGVDTNITSDTVAFADLKQGEKNHWEYAALPNDDLLCIKKGPRTFSAKTEVYALTERSMYQRFGMRVATGLPMTDTNWYFKTTTSGDLAGIYLGPHTTSGKTELHILSHSTNFSTFILQKPIPLVYADRVIYDFAFDPGDNLWIINKSRPGEKISFQVLDKGSDYQHVIYSITTALPEDISHCCSMYFISKQGDLLVFGPSRHRETKELSKTIRVWAATKDSGYQHYLTHDTSFLLKDDMMESGHEMRLIMLASQDLLMVYRAKDPAKVYVVSRTSGYESRIVDVDTGLHES